MFHFLHIQTDSDKYRIQSRYDKHHIYGSHGLRSHIRPDLSVETKCFTFSPCCLVIKTDQEKFKIVRFIAWYDFDCGKSNIKRHIPMRLGEQSMGKKLLQLLGRPHRSCWVV